MQDSSMAVTPWTFSIFRNLDGRLLPWEGQAGWGSALGQTAVFPLPSAWKRSSKLALVSLALLSAQGRRGTDSLQCDPISLGVTVFATLLRHLEPAVFWREAICTHFREKERDIFVILFEHNYKLQANLFFFFFWLHFPPSVSLDEFLQNLRDGKWAKFSKLMCGFVPVFLEEWVHLSDHHILSHMPPQVSVDMQLTALLSPSHPAGRVTEHLQHLDMVPSRMGTFDLLFAHHF